MSKRGQSRRGTLLNQQKTTALSASACARNQGNMKRIYIAGPMTGLPAFNYPAFNEAAAQLRALGYHVENPAENKPLACGTWSGYMRNAIPQMLTCEAVALLPDWENSRGACLEVHVAMGVGMTVLDVEAYRLGLA